MKRFNSIIAIFALAIVATVVAFVSCKKEKQEQGVQPLDKMNEYLVSFKAKLLSAEKGAEWISLEQAQRDLGNLLNYDFGDANYASNVFLHDTLHVKLETTDGMVDLSQLSVTYSTACEMITKAFEKVNLPEKSVSAILCTIAPETIGCKTVDLIFVLTIRGFDFGEKSNASVPGGKSSIDATDCWHVGHGLGRCDNTDVGHDHATILQLVYNNNIPLVNCVSGTYLYYSDISEGTFYALEFPETGFTIYNIGYRLWRGYYNGWNSGLVSPDEMSYYYENLCDIIEQKMEDLNDDEYKVISISCAVFAEPYPELPIKYSFVCKYEYGKPHCGGGSID